MDSAGPIEVRTAGQTSTSLGTNTFTIQDFDKAELFARDWLCRHTADATGPAGGALARPHPSATGERRPA